MRGNERELRELGRQPLTFPIPMRGNEIQDRHRRSGLDEFRFPIPMRGNEQEFGFRQPIVVEFPIPMRGNELRVTAGRGLDAEFPIPMRGNEFTCAIRPLLARNPEFPIPMRGNELRWEYREAASEATRSRSP